MLFDYFLSTNVDFYQFSTIIFMLQTTSQSSGYNRTMKGKYYE